MQTTKLKPVFTVFCARSCEHYDERELCRRAVSYAQLTRVVVCPSHEHGKKIHHSCFFFPSSVFYVLFSYLFLEFPGMY